MRRHGPTLKVSLVKRNIVSMATGLCCRVFVCIVLILFTVPSFGSLSQALKKIIDYFN